jgi:hypothetical protein
MVYGGQNERMAPVPNSQLLDLAELTEVYCPVSVGIVLGAAWLS